MRGGRQPAKPDVARPLDGRVRRLLATEANSQDIHTLASASGGGWRVLRSARLASLGAPSHEPSHPWLARPRADTACPCTAPKPLAQAAKAEPTLVVALPL